MQIHPSSAISSKATIRLVDGGTVTIGRNCHVHDNAMIMTYGGDIRIGDNCSINPFSIVYGHGGVTIGNSVRIAAHTVIIPANHELPTDDKALHDSGVSAVGISISDNVWIGAGARILDGVRIGNNAVVAAGAVVTREVPGNSVVAGVPAKITRRI